MPGGVVEEKVDGCVELQLLQAPRDELIVRQRHFGIKTDAQQSLDLPGIDLAEHLVGVDTGAGKVLLVDAPHARNVRPVLRITDITPSRKLITFLPMFAATLAVGLANNRSVAALGLTDAA
jgi:hypothetical protein